MTGVAVVLIWFDCEQAMGDCNRLLFTRAEKAMPVDGYILAQYLLTSEQMETLKKNNMAFSVQNHEGHLHSIGVNKFRPPLSSEGEK